MEARPVLHMAMELSRATWKVLFNTNTIKPRFRSVEAGDVAALLRAIEWAKERFQVPDAVVVSCYEAGRDGFWIHRFLESVGVRNVVVDPSSIEVNRRQRRVKTDRVDLRKLLSLLRRDVAGERDVWAVARVPTVEQEDARQEHRELERLKEERTGHVNRIKGLLAKVGVTWSGGMTRFARQLALLRLPDGSPLPRYLHDDLVRMGQRLELVNQQIRQVERQRRQRLADSKDDPVLDKVRLLMRVRGVGEVSAWTLVGELFGWRRFHNRREVGAVAGLVGTPYDSGDSVREQGISKAGNQRVRRVMIELAWGWLRWQPDSALAQWFTNRCSGGGGTGPKRLRRQSIVGVARRLLIDLWHLVEHGVIPKGVELLPTR